MDYCPLSECDGEAKRDPEQDWISGCYKYEYWQCEKCGFEYGVASETLPKLDVGGDVPF